MIISNYGISSEVALNIFTSNTVGKTRWGKPEAKILTFEQVAKKFKVSVELVKLIKSGNYLKRKKINLNEPKGQKTFRF